MSSALVSQKPSYNRKQFFILALLCANLICKRIVCFVKILNLVHLSRNAAAVMPNTLQRTLAKFDHRGCVRKATNGAHIKPYPPMYQKQLCLTIFKMISTTCFYNQLLVNWDIFKCV